MTGEHPQATEVVRLRLNDFRNISQLEVTPAPGGLTVVRGENGAGKTSLLEALSYCSLMRSFRGVAKESVIKSGSERASVGCEVRRGSRLVELAVAIDPLRRDIPTVNKKRVSGPKELAAILQTTLFTPDDLGLVKGGPASRRDLLDDALLLTSPRIGAERAVLDRILRQRSALLKQMNGRLDTDGETTLDVWDDRLASTGTALVEGREALVEALSPHVAEAWASLSGEGGSIELFYVRSFVGELSSALSASRVEDLRRQVTTIGPHRDELEIVAGTLDARTRLSQGRQRCAALSLKLGIHRYVADKTGSVPVLLLDDAFSELDARTAGALVRELPLGQAILTTAGDLPPGATPDLVLQIAGGMLL